MTDTAIEIRRDNIPIKPEDLRKFILVGRRVVEAHKAKLKAIAQIETAAAAHQAALADAQTIAEVVLDAEAKLGEMLAAIEPNIESSGRGTIVKHTSLPPGIDKKMSHEAQQIHKHPEVVERCKSQARQKGDIVTSQSVLRQVRSDSQNDSAKKPVKTGPPERGYYLTEPRLAQLRKRTTTILTLLDVPTNSLCPVSVVRAEVSALRDELQKLEPYKKTNKRKEH